MAKDGDLCQKGKLNLVVKKIKEKKPPKNNSISNRNINFETGDLLRVPSTPTKIASSGNQINKGPLKIKVLHYDEFLNFC